MKEFIDYEILRKKRMARLLTEQIDHKEYFKEKVKDYDSEKELLKGINKSLIDKPKDKELLKTKELLLGLFLETVTILKKELVEEKDYIKKLKQIEEPKKKKYNISTIASLEEIHEKSNSIYEGVYSMAPDCVKESMKEGLQKRLELINQKED